MRRYVTLTPKTSKGGITLDDLIKELEDYRDGLDKKTEEFISRLIDIGITTAENNTGEYAGMISFEKRVDKNTGYLIATDGQKIIRQWRYKGEVKSAEVSPLLMSEFGSGQFAEVLFNIKGVGRGSFPDQKHAFEDEWYWTTLDNVTHRSSGEKPTHPIHNAFIEMEESIVRIAREVYG